MTIYEVKHRPFNFGQDTMVMGVKPLEPGDHTIVSTDRETHVPITVLPDDRLVLHLGVVDNPSYVVPPLSVDPRYSGLGGIARWGVTDISIVPEPGEQIFAVHSDGLQSWYVSLLCGDTPPEVGSINPFRG